MFSGFSACVACLVRYSVRLELARTRSATQSEESAVLSFGTDDSNQNSFEMLVWVEVVIRLLQ